MADLLVADQLSNAEQVTLDADFLRDEWSRAGFDLATDAWVAVDHQGAVVGYGQAVREEPTVVDSWGVVHPERSGLGIGSSLLDRIEERASTLLAGASSGRFRHTINAGDRAASAMLRPRGLRPVRHFWHMQIDLTGPFEPGLAPDGIAIAGVATPDDLPAVHAVLSDAFVDDWGHHPEPVDQWIEEHTANPSYDPTLWLLATEGRRPVSALTASILEDSGWVDYLGVRPGYRGRGIGAALLRHSFAMFAGRGIPRVILNVDAQNPTGATALYERVGMRAVKQWDLWERSSRTSGAPNPARAASASGVVEWRRPVTPGRPAMGRGTADAVPRRAQIAGQSNSSLRKLLRFFRR